MTLVRKLILYYLIPLVVCIQMMVSSFYYLMFKQTLMENKFRKLFLINLSYVVLPLLPISFTYFWKITTLYGTVCLLKTLKTLKKILLNTNSNSDQLLLANNTETDKLLLDKQVFPTSSSSIKLNDLKNNNNQDHETQSEANLNQDDLSQINDLSSIDSLLAAMPMSKKKINAESYLSKFKKNLIFYFKIIAIILFNNVPLASNDKILNDTDLQNASFIYFTNFLIGLGIITNFSCIDKKGILSWPNPTAEKILLLNNNVSNREETVQENDDDELLSNVPETNELIQTTKESDLIIVNETQTNKPDTPSIVVNPTNKNVIETFNLTHDNSNGFTLKFDDINWCKNMNSLKPLGLSILLNTCNKKLISNHTKFTDFIKVESNRVAHQNQLENLFANNANNSFSSNMSINEENFELKAIIDRRCICEISKIIGFDSKQAIKSYEIIGTSSLCRNLEIKSASKVKPKQIRLSNMFSIVAAYNLNGLKNLYSQGSPDLILDFCTSFWNGKQVCELSKNQRKKLLDLYQRYSVSSYVTAFSYKPVIDEKKLLDIDFNLNSNHVIKCPASYCEKLSSHLDSVIDYSNVLLNEDSSSFE